MEQFNIETAIQQARNAHSLIIRGDLFTQQRLSDLTENECKNEKLILSNHLVLTRDSCDSKEKKRTEPSTWGPKHKPDVFTNNFFYDVEPKFTKLNPKYLQNQLEELNNALQYRTKRRNRLSLVRFGRRLKAISKRKSTCKVNSDENDFDTAFEQLVLKPCQMLLVGLLGHKFRTSGILNYSSNGVLHKLKHCMLIHKDSKSILAIEMRDPEMEALTKKGNSNHRLTETNANFNLILKQMCLFLIASNLEAGILTNFEVTILIKPNLLQVSETNVRDIYPVNEEDTVKVPFEYMVIINTDCGFTVQAVMASILY